MRHQTPENLAEAKRLALLSPEEQRAFVEMLRAVARNPKVADADRREARRRAEALQELLGFEK